MKVLALVGDQVAPIFVLAGMETISPKSPQELQSVFTRIIQQKEVAMLLISARYAKALKKQILEVQMSSNPIVILEISSSRGDFHAGERLMQHIKQTIGQS